MAELALGIAGLAGTIDVCIKLGHALRQLSRDYAKADAKLHELSVRIDVCWGRISTQLEISQHMKQSMSDECMETQQKALRILEAKLGVAVLCLSKPSQHAKPSTWLKFSFIKVKESLEGAVTELEQWQKVLEPSYFQLVKMGPSTLDGMLGQIAITRPGHTTLPTQQALGFRRAFKPGESNIYAEKTLQGLERTAIPYCAAVKIVEPENGKLHIVDTVSNKAVKLNNARDLAYRLRDSSPSTFGMLRCKGIVNQPSSSEFSFMFRVPDGFNATYSLRELLLRNQPPESLSIRLHIAKQLVTAVYYTHLYEFVHKNISPETILGLGNGSAVGLDGTVVCLIGFQVIRYADGKTNTAGLSRKNYLYQHPLRLGDEGVDFVMQHDIYSLGVCLLEIGLWESFIEYGFDGVSQVSRRHGLSEHEPNILGSVTDKECMLALSRGALRMTMGDKYSRVVQTCLSCLDAGNLDFGDPREFEDDDGVEVGARYVSKVMDIMADISL